MRLAQTGDADARAELLLRYREPLARFLHGRLSPQARSALDTTDIVQETLTAALQRLEHFEYRGIGSYWAYLRRIGLNLLMQERRRSEARELALDSAHQVAVAGRGPSSELLHQERLLAVDTALASVPERVRNALLLRLELGLSYAQVARECDFPSANAARMAICRAMTVLATELAGLQP